MQNKTFLIGLLMVATTSSIAQPTSAPKYSNEFMSIGVGARAFGMAGVQVASVSDVTAGFWNPAGLMTIPCDFQVALMHSPYFAGIAKHDYGAIAKRIKGSERVIGFSIVRFAVDDIPNTIFLREPNGTINYDNVTSFSVADYGFLFSYAQPIKQVGWRVGGNLKVIHRKAGRFTTAWGFGADVALQYDYNQHWKFGIMGKDITTTFNAWTTNLTDAEKEVFANTGNEIPQNSIEITKPKLIGGVAYYHDWKQKKMSILAEFNLDITTDGRRNVVISGDPFSVDPHFGFEAGYAQVVYLRGGIGNIQRATNDMGERITTFQPNIGVGLRIQNFRIDYALANIGGISQAPYSHVFSLMLDIQKPNK